MAQQDPPKIEFPCANYPVKIMGDATDVMRQFVLETTESFAPGFNRLAVDVKTSRKGRYQSLTVYITATGVDQLQQYHQALMEHPSIKMVL